MGRHYLYDAHMCACRKGFTMVFVAVNYQAVLAATAVSMVLGWLWYSPMVAGNAWMHAMKMNPKDCKPSGMHFLGEAVTTFIRMWVLALVLMHFAPVSMAEGLMYVGTVWLGFTAATEFSGVIWGGFPINAFYLCSAGSLLRFLAGTAVLLSM